MKARFIVPVRRLVRPVLARYDWLADPASGAAVRERLVASLSSPWAPAPRDGALIVLLHSGRLWDWAFNDTIPRGFSKPWRRGPLFDRAEMIASGALVPDGVPAADLPMVARVLYRHIRDNSG